ncbi:MAG: hypothetical protein QOK15_3291 [Nocardioidaceae bacterium]|jgi:uncharacterized protein YndB with AHSA1/START domain|nr:hypothetical protein [Nocardioidaceae bacterium]
MAEFHAAVSIARSREDVFTYLVDPANQTVWNSGLVEFEADWTGDPQVGDRARGTVKVAGRRIDWETETIEAQRPDRVVYRSVKAPFSFQLSWTLTDRGGDTEVTHDGLTGTLGGFFGKLADPLVALMYQRDMNSNLANLKAVLEEQ